MLQEYVLNVSSILVLGCSKYIFMLQVISVLSEVAYVAAAIHVCYKCMFQIF